MLAECRKLSRRKGLSARFVRQRSEARLEGRSCVVYDTSVYSYGQILEECHAQSNPDVLIGTFSMKNRVLITPKEIIR